MSHPLTERLTLVAALLLLCPLSARAQPESAADTPSPAEQASGLRSRLALSVAERLLRSSDPAARERALLRLGATGGTRALEMLVSAVDTEGVAKTSRERLTAVRALAPHVRTPMVLRALVRMMNGAGETERDDRLESWVRSSAALALAASGQPAALEALGMALRQPGPIAEAARTAVTAHPPEDLQPLLKSRGAPTIALVRALAELSDQRAFHALRQFVMHGSPAVRAEAAIALTELGDLETVELARHWLKTEKAAFVREAATRILALAATSDAPERIADLLRNAETRRAGLELSLKAPSERLAPALVELSRRELQHEDRAQLLAALGRTGTAAAVERLAELVRQGGPLSKLAAYPLAMSPHPAAALHITKLLSESGPRRRLALRSAVIRQRALGSSVKGIDRSIEAMLASADPGDRYAAAWAMAVLDPQRGVELLATRDPAILHALGSVSHQREIAEVAAQTLAAEADPFTRIALAPSLLVPEAADAVPTSRLMDFIDEASPEAHAAAFALGARWSPETQATIAELLESPDPALRAHVAAGLGHAGGRSATALLHARYAVEPEAGVRRAIVGATARLGTSTDVTLDWAATLDPSPDVRQLARLGRNGQAPEPQLHGSSAVWIALEGTDAGPAVGALILPSGLNLPAVSAPDGLWVWWGLAEGPVSLRLAAPPLRDKAEPSESPTRK